VLNSRLNMPRAETPKKTPSKSDYIRSQPVTMSPVEIVAKAKAEGINVSRALVYMVRGRAQGKAKKTSTVKPGAPGSAKSPASKAAFVRGLPASTPAKDVVKQAKAAGIKLGISYVYNIRGAAKMAAKKRRAAAKSPAVGAVANGDGSRVSARAENLLKAVAAEIGLGPSIEILQGERARVRAVIGG
jgi:hypothetical protein